MGWTDDPMPDGSTFSILLIPSLGTSTRLFDALKAALPMRFPQVVVESVDLPGHGRGPRAQSFSIADLADEVASHLGRREAGRRLIVGVSMGGAIALEVARRHPQVVQGIVQINSGVEFGDEAGWSEIVTKVVKGGTAALADSSRVGWFSEEFRDSWMAEALVAELTSIDDATYVACCGALQRYRGGFELADITTPALLIGTADDRATPASAMQDVAAQLGRAQFSLLQSGRHLSVAEHAVEISERIARWWQEETKR